MVERDMTMNYYLAWLHFDSHGRMMTRLPDGHRVLEVLVKSGSNRHAPALWVLVEAVVATPSYTPAAGFQVPGEMPAEYRQPGPVSGPQQAASRPDYSRYYSNGGRTLYPELSPEARDDDYRQPPPGNSGNYSTDDYVPGVPTSPAKN